MGRVVRMGRIFLIPLVWVLVAGTNLNLLKIEPVIFDTFLNFTKK
jgi:hypothetical protein